MWVLVFEFMCKGFKVHHNVRNASRSYYGVRIVGEPTGGAPDIGAFERQP